METNLVYEKIAHHFDGTRYRIWPSVKKFMDKIPDNNKVVDLGCGNGKNMINYPKLKFIAIDNCNEFLKIVDKKNKGNIKTVQGDIRKIPLKDNTTNYLICVAVFHHLYNDIDRIKCLNEIERVVKKNGSILITLWAMEQPNNKRKSFSQQDNMIPWHNRTDGKIYQRYYRIWYENDFEEYINKTNFKIKEKFYENGNWTYYLVNKK
tara:strand:+ start:3435 stop:4055 length:621 start_codon:yes stop_codon:yes gene_type:complete